MKFATILGLLLAQVSLGASAVVMQSNDERIMALYAMVDLDVANTYLKPQGLEAVDIGGGKALTGFLVACYNDAEFVQLGQKVEKYCVTSLPMLVTKPGTAVQGGYLFSRELSDNVDMATLNLQYGMSSLLQVADITMSDLKTTDVLVKQTAKVVMSICPTDDANCKTGDTHVSLVMGKSKKDELVASNDLLKNLYVSDQLPAGGHAVSTFELGGPQYSRPFDPARDSYYVAPGSPQAAVLNHPSFQPTVWVTGTQLPIVVKDMTIL